MAFFVALIMALWIGYFSTTNINDGLPIWKCKKSFWIVWFLYTFIRCAWVYFLLLSILQLRWNTEAIVVWLACYGVAYGIKKLARYLAYNLKKCPF